jgi:outer membrane protein OmpA-like peptidoglycan-associated protein
VEGRLGQFEGRLGQVDAKTDKALNTLANLRLERRFVIDMKEGANFAFNSANLPAQAQKEIDGFLSDLKGDAAGADGTIFLVAGHTDNVGSEDINFELGKKRADAVSRYLITQKKMDPLKVISVSYGESAPLQDNSTGQGRAKNRRVEILCIDVRFLCAERRCSPICRAARLSRMEKDLVRVNDRITKVTDDVDKKAGVLSPPFLFVELIDIAAIVQFANVVTVP